MSVDEPPPVPGIRTEGERVYLTQTGTKKEPTRKERFFKSVSSTGRRVGQGTVKIAGKTARTTVAAGRVGRQVGGVAKRTLTTDPYDRIRQYDLDIELARRKARLQQLKGPRFQQFRIGQPRPRSRKRADPRIKSLESQVRQLRSEIKRLRA